MNAGLKPGENTTAASASAIEAARGANDRRSSQSQRRRWPNGICSAPLPRSEVVSKVWDHIRKNKLQNPANKREILADDKLKKVFGGKDKVSMFEMNKHLSNHLK